MEARAEVKYFEGLKEKKNYTPGNLYAANIWSQNKDKRNVSSNKKVN